MYSCLDNHHEKFIHHSHKQIICKFVNRMFAFYIATMCYPVLSNMTVGLVICISKYFYCILFLSVNHLSLSMLFNDSLSWCIYLCIDRHDLVQHFDSHLSKYPHIRANNCIMLYMLCSLKVCRYALYQWWSLRVQ